MMPHTEADLNGADLMLFVGTGGGGVAWVGVICDNKGNSSKGIENKTIRRYRKFQGCRLCLHMFPFQ